MYVPPWFRILTCGCAAILLFGFTTGRGQDQRRAASERVAKRLEQVANLFDRDYVEITDPKKLEQASSILSSMKGESNEVIRRAFTILDHRTKSSDLRVRAAAIVYLNLVFEVPTRKPGDHQRFEWWTNLLLPMNDNDVVVEPSWPWTNKESAHPALAPCSLSQNGAVSSHVSQLIEEFERKLKRRGERGHWRGT